MEHFANILSYISIISVLIPIVTFLLYPSQYRAAILISVLIMVALASDIANECFVRSGQKGFIIINSYFILQFILLGAIYHYILKRKLMVKIVMIIYLILLILNTLTLQGFNEFQHFMRIYECVAIIGFGIGSYTSILKTPLEDKNRNFLILWINMAVLFYFFFNLYLFGISNYVLKDMFRDDAMVIWGFHSVNNITKNIFFALALFEAGRGTRIIRPKLKESAF